MPAVLIPAAVDAVIIAVMAALLIWAFLPVFRALLQALAQLPFVGAYLAGRAEVLAQQAVNNGRAWAMAGLRPLADLINGVAWRLYFWRQSVLAAATATVLALWRVRYQVLPALEARVIGYAQRLYAAALAYAAQLYAQAIAFAQHLYDLAIAFAQALYQAAVAYAAQLYAQSIAFAQALYAQAIGYALTLEQAALGYAQALYEAAIRYAQAVLATALGFAEDAFGRAIDYERQLYGDSIRFAESVRTWARDYADARVGALAAAVAASIAALGIRVLRLERSKCQRFCDPLGDLGQDLEDLSGLFEAGALFALAGAAARDPRGWASEVAGDLVQPLREAAGAVLGETGVSTRAA